jgi:hypothetical protein
MRTISYLLLGLLIGGSMAVAMAQPIVTESTSKSETKVESPPPSAISPNITTINNKNCSTGISGATQTQILGISFGATVKDTNCEMIVKAESLFLMQMKTAAVSVMCQDSAIWWGMWDAGTYCPVEGMVGVQAKDYWLANPKMIPDRPKIK